MASEGIGKIKSKKTHQAKKPYDRSTSFFGKIKDSVKDLLIPSWLVQSSDTISDSAETKGPLQSSSQFALSSVGCNGPATQSPSFKQSTSSDVDHIPHLNEIRSHQSRLPGAVPSGPGRHNIRGKPFLDEEGPAPNVNIAALEKQNISWHAKEKESPIFRVTNAFQQETKKKSVDAAQMRMSDSYLEESVDTTSSAAPSQIMMSTSAIKKHCSKSVQDTSQLWSPEGFRLRKALVPPIKDKPAFNAFLFASSKAKAEGFGDSSFYSGKTCYGGSAGRRRKNLNTSLPYQSSLPLRKQVTANKMNNSLNATTSSTAQRILETLDRMSTPLGDAKKIPQEESTNDSVISFTPSSYRRTSSIGSLRSVTRPLQLPSRGPPTSQHKALSQAELARNRNRLSTIDRRGTEEDNSNFIVSQEPSAVREPIRPSFPTEQLSCQTTASGSSGKLKSKKFSQHVSTRKDEDEDVPVVPNLRTDFTLPITNINPISFSSQTSVASSIPSRVAASALQFTFSTPIEERRPSSSNQSLKNSHQGFKFSSPIKASQPKMNAAGAEEGSKSSLEPDAGASSALPVSNFSIPVPAWKPAAPKPKQGSPDISGTSSSFKSYDKWVGFNNDNSATSDVSSPASFSLTPAVSLKSGSVMDILGGKSSSSGAAAPAAVSPPKVTDDLMAKFKKPAGTWECDTCMLSNKPEAVKCIACEAPKPGASISVTNKVLPTQETEDLMAKFKKPTGTWECEICMLSNKPEANKCIACEAPKPGGASKSGTADSSNNSLSAMFKKPVGTWECDICMVQNGPTASRCVACDSPKPGLEAAGIVFKKSVNSTSSVTFAPGGGFVFNSLPTSTAATSFSGFNLSNSSISTPSNSLPAPTGFVFGQTKLSSTESASIPITTSSSLPEGFKFGTSAMTTSGQISGITVSQASAASVFTNGSQNLNDVATLTSNAAAQYQFSSVQKTTMDSVKSDKVSEVVEVRPEEKLNFNTNGDSPNQNSYKSTVSSFVFKGTDATRAFSPLTKPTQLASQSAMSQPANTFNFAAPKSSAPQLSSAAPEISTSSSLVQFGVTPAVSSVSKSTGLGMGPSLTSDKALVNGGFAFSSSKYGDSANVKTGFPTYAVPERNSFIYTSEGSASSQQGQTNKRATGSEDSGAPSAKKVFNFGQTNKEATINGGFHFGGAAQSSVPSFGVSGGAASAPAPVASSGFNFAQNTKQPASQPSGPASSGGFHFNSDTTANTGFNFGSAATGAKPFEQSAQVVAFKAGNLTGNFNFGSVGQTSSVPFQFAGKQTDNAASAAATFAAPQVSQLNGPSFGSALSGMGAVGSFSLGVGDTNQRKVKKAIRRIPRK